jgi:PTS system mannose-specific IID component
MNILLCYSAVSIKEQLIIPEATKKVKKSTLIKIFLRSFFIHTTLNFRRMQNLGFVMAIIPLIRDLNLPKKDVEGLLTRHLQMFNTHPYFSAPVIGSVLRLEEEHMRTIDSLPSSSDAVVVKQSLMGPYAAIGDTFFWGALRPLCAIISFVLAYSGLIIAPVVFLLLYTPAHIWVRLKGFFEGYRRGKQGIEFIRVMDLPRIAVRIRWLSLAILAGSAIWLTGTTRSMTLISSSEIVIKLIAMTAILLCLLLIKKGVSQIYILYGTFLLFLIISVKGILPW